MKHGICKNNINFFFWKFSLIGCYMCAERSVNAVHGNGHGLYKDPTEYINTYSWKLGKVWKAILGCNVKAGRQGLDVVDLPQEAVLWRGVVNQGMNSLKNSIGQGTSKGASYVYACQGLCFVELLRVQNEWNVRELTHTHTHIHTHHAHTHTHTHTHTKHTPLTNTHRDTHTHKTHTTHTYTHHIHIHTPHTDTHTLYVKVYILGEIFYVIVISVWIRYTVMRRITTFRSTTGRIYDGGPIRL